MGIFENLIKGIPDWHTLLNRNFAAAQTKLDSIDTALSNKADKIETVLDAKRAYQNYTTVLEMVNAVSDDSSVIAFGDNQSTLYNAEDRPPVLSEYFYVILSDGLRKNVIAFGFTGRNIYMRRVWNKVWSTDWTQAATCYCADMEPKILPLSSNWITWNPGWEVTYRKTYDGFVVINGTVKPSESNQDPPSLQQIGTLPTNFSPKRAWYNVCATSGGRGWARIRVDPSGAVFLDGYSDKISLLASLELMLIIDTKV